MSVKNYQINTIDIQLVIAMNRIINIFLILVLVISVFSSCNNTPVNDKVVLSEIDTVTAEIKFREYEHDFGKVAEGETVEYTFTFDNTGAADLILTSAGTTCGCTVPKYDSKPISPGKSGTLVVEFDTSGRNGMQTKTITVKSNASIPVIILKITAEVVNSLN